MDRKKIIYIGLLLIVTIFSLVTYFSYAFFAHTDEYHGKLNIVVGTLDYMLQSSELTDNSITLAANETKKFEITITSLNSIDSKYELYYTSSNSNVYVSYLQISDTPTGTILKNGRKKVNVFVKNLSNSTVNVTFGVLGGFVSNNLVLEEGSSIDEIEQVTAPVIEGGTGENNWVSTSPVISIATAGSADSGINYYEYYWSEESTTPSEIEAAKGTTNSNYTVTNEGTTYVWYRTVSNNGVKSVWSGPQVVNLDTTSPTAPILSINRKSDDYLFGNVSSGSMETIIREDAATTILTANSTDLNFSHYKYTAYLMMNTHKMIPTSYGGNNTQFRINYDANSISANHHIYFDYIVDTQPSAIDFNDTNLSTSSYNIVRVNDGYRIFGKYRITEYDVTGTSGGRLYDYDTMRFFDISNVNNMIDNTTYYPISEISSSVFTTYLQIPNLNTTTTYYEIRAVDKAGNESAPTYVLVTKGTAYTATNLVTNGSFENGFNNWDTNNSKHYSISNEKYSGEYSIKYELININDYSDVSIIVQFIDANLFIVNHKYYSSYMFKTLSNNYSCVNGFEIYDNTNFLETRTSAINWKKISGLITLTKSSNHFRSYTYNNNTCSSEDVFADDYILIDLTEIFGSGNEPSKEWCDNHIDYFDGTTIIYK